MNRKTMLKFAGATALRMGLSYLMGRAHTMGKQHQERQERMKAQAEQKRRARELNRLRDALVGEEQGPATISAAAQEEQRRRERHQTVNKGIDYGAHLRGER